MPLAAGARLGVYEILGLIGAGGMGVVYRAYDERLERPVAIKFLAEVGDSSPGERTRLLVEARAASALNHPHICTIYEVGEFEGHPFIVMEYVEGRPLAKLVPHEGLPAETVTRYGLQLADALAHAHARGVIHRDFKAANIVVNEQGAAKILDFGLARRIELQGGDAATATANEEEGTALTGTLAYMAPEVLLGEAADARSDIWSLGVVLYEIATGRFPFSGRNAFDLSAAILRAAPERFPAHVPPALRAVVTRCLSKEPAQRYQHAGETRAALEAIRSDVVSVDRAMSLRSRRSWIVAAVCVAAALAVVAFSLWDREPDWGRFAADAQLTRVLSSDDPASDPFLSQDGRMLCYVLQTPDGRTDVYAGRVAGGARIRLTNDDAIEGSPRFSPDGELVAFARRVTQGAVAEIHIVPTLGGEIIGPIARGGSPAWSADGRHLAFVREADAGGGAELAVVAADGTNPRVLVPADSAYPFLRNPSWSPDGRRIAFIRGMGGVAGEIWLVSSTGGTPRRLGDEPASLWSDTPVFTPDGRGIIHSSNRGGATNLWVSPVDGGAPVRLTSGPGPDQAPSVAADGAIAFVNSRWRNLLQAYDQATGESRTLLVHTPFVWGPAVSPDGREVAFSRMEMDGSWHVWVVPSAGGTARRLTSGSSGELYPRWSPDGQFVLFHTWGLPRRIGRVSTAGGQPEWFSFAGEERDSFADLSPDGRTVVFTRADGQMERIYVAALAGGSARLVTASAAAVPKWSPDGTRIAFSSSRSYSGGIFTVAPDGTRQVPVASDGGWPVWWPDGTRIGYLAVDRRGNQEIRVVPAAGGASRALPIALGGTNHPFAVTPDGRTIIVSNSEHVSDEIWLLERKR